MAARPPQKTDSEPETIAFGIAAVDEALENADITFPADGEEIVEATGDPQIPFDSRGRTMDLSEAIAECGQREFATRRELLNALHPVFEEKRGSGRIGQWLRSLFPF
jgi:hypothetical protein